MLGYFNLAFLMLHYFNVVLFVIALIDAAPSMFHDLILHYLLILVLFNVALFKCRPIWCRSI